MKYAVAVASLFLGACGTPPSVECSAVESYARVCAKGTTTKGIDVSYYQGVVDWDKVKTSGQIFAFARVSDGINTPDAQFQRNWTEMKGRVIRGTYQFFRPSQDAIKQADLVLSKLTAAGGLEDTDLPPVLDFETLDGQTSAVAAQKAQQWLTHIEDQLGRRPIVYSGNNMATTTGTKFSTYPLWLPNYTTQCPLLPSGWADWTIWQNSSTGVIPGISGNVDTNLFNGDAAALTAFVASTVKHGPTDDLGPPDAGTAGAVDLAEVAPTIDAGPITCPK